MSIHIQNKLKEEFAELCGIHAGDGWLASKPNEVGYGTSINEKQYFNYVFKLYSKIFDFHIFRIVKRGKPYNTIEVRIACKNTYNLLINTGFPQGPKLDKLRIPKFIFSNKNYFKGFLRGLIDTDGTVYWRKNRNNYYLILAWNCTNKKFAYEIKSLLEMLGYSPHIYSFINKKSDYKRRTAWRVYLQRKIDVYNFITIIGFKNSVRIKQVFSKKQHIEKYGLGRN